jgi:2-C-methyl-D-erythritol 2,4-cyclodiphosphate synthase
LVSVDQGGEILFRIGFGYDVHGFSDQRRLVLGGVWVPHERGLEGHSDADVLVHAVMDAILGALGRGDIGRHFPDKDPTFKDADSMELLGKVMGLAQEDGFRLNNLDATIVAQRPRMLTYIEEMRVRLSAVLAAPPDMINIKATTSEGLGFCGREEGIAAYAVVSLRGRADEHE